jgi:hypothetical protein
MLVLQGFAEARSEAIRSLLFCLILPGLDHPNEASYRIIAEELMRLF